MNSCRNCVKSKHGWGFIPTLDCVQTKRTVAPPMSRSTEENQKIDAALRTIAAACTHYEREGEMQ